MARKVYSRRVSPRRWGIAGCPSWRCSRRWRAATASRSSTSTPRSPAPNGCSAPLTDSEPGRRANIAAAMQCVILAGGLATRMRPLTERIPKALIPAGGRPFVDHQLAWLSGHGVTDVVMCIGYRGDAIRAHLQTGASHGLRIRFVDEGEDLRGTAGALRLALEAGALEESFLVTYGDS